MLPSEEPILHVGDRLRIVCPERPALCVDRTVGPDGTIDVPELGAAPAAIQSTRALQRWIEEHITDTVLPPWVEVLRLGSARDAVSVVGAVARPLLVYAPHGIGRDRLLSAAKPLPDADLALLDRRLRIGAGTLLSVASVSVDRRISILGAVANPQTLSPAKNLLLGSAIDAAGGLETHADPNGLVVVRAGESIPLALPADAGFRLQPGDVVRVGQIADRHFILVRGLVVHPGPVEYAPGMTATRLLASAGGPLPEARAGVLVWQTGGKTFRLSLAFILDRRIPDPTIGPSDTLAVEAGRP